MQHEDALVNVLDDQGNIIGTKLRKEINKRADIVHCADVIVIRPDQKIVLAKLPTGTLYENTWATTAATMIRAGEEAEDAAELKEFTKDELKESIKSKPNEFSPTLQAIWETYHDNIR